MFKDRLYKIVSSAHQNGTIDAVIELDKANEIFNGHFPGQPVLPGACMLQLLKEVLEQELKQSIRLKKADQIKFLSVVDPQIDQVLHLKIACVLAEDKRLSITANFTFQNNICFKFKGVFE